MSKRVWATRDEPPDGPMGRALQACGLTAIHEPVLTRRVVEGALAAIDALGPGDWLVLTSPFAIELAAASPSARVPRVAVVGEPSRRAAETHRLRVELVGDGSGDSLFAALRKRATCGKVCYARSSLAPLRTGWPGVELSCPILYETVPRPYDRSVAGRVDVVAVASPSAVEAVGPANRPFASIGATTSQALRHLGVEPWAEAARPSFEELAAAIAETPL